MTRPRPRIVVTLPARTVEQAVRQLRSASAAGADEAEIRVDRLAADERSQLARLFPSPVPVVATYRSRAEGGEGEDDPAGRRAVLLELAALPFRWLDLELRRDLAIAGDLPSSDRLGRIVSCHLAADAPPDLWRRRLEELEEVEGVGKLVVDAAIGKALREIAPEVERLGDDVVVLTTGPSGPLFRAWSRRYGFPLVYAALPQADAAAPVEPSQIAVDRLRPFLAADEPGPLFAVCGRPVGHSRSPSIHARWMREDRRAGLYVPLEFADDQEFVDALGPLARGGFRGLNVTHPFKTVAAAAATELGPGARACGAANCLTLEGEAVQAENTDLLAILRRLEELRGTGAWDGAELAVVGAGGAARATLAAARELGVRATVYARRPEAAREVAARFGAVAGSDAPAKAVELIVHATDVGRERRPSLEVAVSRLLERGGHLLDWVYAPTGGELRRAAEAASATYEDGWRLLVYQAAASYEIWWGSAPAGGSVEALVAEGPCAA